MNLRSLIPTIREVASYVVTRGVSQEAAQFEESWSTVKGDIARWAKRPPEKWTCGAVEKELASGLGYRGRAARKEPSSLVVISTVAGVLYHLAGFSNQTDEAEVRRLVETYGLRYGMSPGAVGLLSQVICQLQALWLGVAVDLQGERAVQATMPRLSSRVFLSVEIGYESGVPCVRFNGTEAPIFRTKEYAFAMFSFLCAARKSGEGWLSKIDDLLGSPPHTQELYKLRSEYLGVLGLKNLIQSSDRRDSRVRVDLPPGAIKIRKSLEQFVSVHRRSVVGLMSFLAKRENPTPQILENLEREAYRLGRNTTLVRKALDLMGLDLDLEDMSWQDILKEVCTYLGPYVKKREDQAEVVEEFLASRSERRAVARTPRRTSL
jgi:hypothetical protein